MDPLLRLIREAHRRSLWQVLGLYAVGAWVVIQVVEVITESAGLPGWTPGMALVLLLIGLPIVMATAFVQEGAPGLGGGEREPSEPPAAATSAANSAGNSATTSGAPSAADDAGPGGLERHLTWKRALLGGLAALLLLAVAAGGYVALWAGGVGSMGSLVAQDLIEEGERIVLAGFESSEEDEDLAAMVTEALRIDLTRSPILSVVEPAEVRSALARMGRAPDAPFPGDVALELATREGVKAVLRGEVGRIGAGYVITASLVAAEGDRTLAAFRETAESEEGLIDAVDRLSREIREKAGESLRSIRRGEPLSRVTTTSLPALRLYTRAIEASDRGESLRAVALLEDAVERDPDFAMAWRKLGVELNNAAMEPERADSALARAYRLRDRLTERERYLAEAMYHSSVRQNRSEAISAYEQLLGSDPEDTWALNNVSILLWAEDRHEESIEMGYRGLRAGSELAGTNLVIHLAALGRLAEADSVLVSMELPEDHPSRTSAEFVLRLRQGRFEEADRLARSVLEDRSVPEATRLPARFWRAAVALAAGRLDEMDAQAERAAAAASGLGAEPLRLLGELTPVVARALIDLPFEDGERAWLLERAREAPDGMFGGQARAAISGILALEGDVERATEASELYRSRLPDDPSRELRREVLHQDALLRLAAGDPEAALATLERARAEGGCEECFALDRAVILRELGRAEEAIRELEREMSVVEMNLNWPLQGVAEVQRARSMIGPLYEEVGDTTAAIETYRILAERWRDADPVLQPRVEGWRERIRELEEGEGPQGS